ncbi:unnamed protein product [Caenorhabditis sp. 36 PRJEB53466]|nr:unnamed protein product [Caenorhabditis sp. 36 PRJEB53466]
MLENFRKRLFYRKALQTVLFSGEMQAQQQLKSGGDIPKISPNRTGLNSRRSINNGGSNAKKCTGGAAPFLATDVTTLDINTMFQSKKLKRNGAERPAVGSAPSTPTQNSYQSSAFNFPTYLNPTSLYSNLDLMHAASGGDHLPPLMSVPAYKPNNFMHAFGTGDTNPLDFAQFTEELNALQSMSSFPTSSPMSLQSLFCSETSPFLSGFHQQHQQKNGLLHQTMGPALSTVSSSSTSRSPNGRKNRMVEVKTINDRPVIVVSDPTAASAAARSTIVQLNRNVLGILKGLQAIKKRPTSQEALYSRKVFIGGLPIDVTEEEVWTTFGSFGKVLVDWPRRPEHGSRGDYFDMEMGRRNSRSVSGYVFLVFQNEQSVQELVNACEFYENKYYLQLSSPTMSDKAVQVRAWRLSDIDYFCDEKSFVDHRRTVFIGGVPRPTRASDLARCLEEHYGKVSYVGIDIDPELKYPKGAARVTFATAQSFVRAISGRFVQVTHADTNKRVEIKPYVMEDQYCDECQGKLCKHNYAPYFCGDPACLQYYCEACWDRMHYEMSELRSEHRPMVRTGDQTRILPRPPHHSSAHFHHRQQQNHHQLHQNAESTSFISRIVNRHHSSPNTGTAKPFSAIPTAIGY